MYENKQEAHSYIMKGLSIGEVKRDESSKGFSEECSMGNEI